MRTAASLQDTAAKSQCVSKPSPVRLLLQRKCACGGSPGASGKCEECQGKRIQTKLAIGASNDALEQEADQVAAQVLAAPSRSVVSGVAPRIQRVTGQSSGDAETTPASVHHTLSGSGSPLEAALRQDMEQRFGHDFSRVRVHSGAAAEQSAREVNAHAYTAGSSIVFGAGQFAPGSHEGRRLLAHELTHVVQQTGAAGIYAGHGGAERGLSSSGKNHVIHKQEAKTTTDTKQDKSDHSKLTLQLTEPDFLSLRKPFFDRNISHLWDPNSALGVWKFNVNFFKGFGITENWARKAANLTAPFAIDAQLKAGNLKWWEITDRELKTTSIVGSVPLFSFDADFKNWKPLPFLQK